MNPIVLGIAVLVLVGLFGIMVPVLPGTVLVAGAILVWAIAEGTGEAWAMFARRRRLPGGRHGRQVPRARAPAEGLGSRPAPCWSAGSPRSSASS